MNFDILELGKRNVLKFDLPQIHKKKQYLPLLLVFLVKDIKPCSRNTGSRWGLEISHKCVTHVQKKGNLRSTINSYKKEIKNDTESLNSVLQFRLLQNTVTLSVLGIRIDKQSSHFTTINSGTDGVSQKDSKFTLLYVFPELLCTLLLVYIPDYNNSDDNDTTIQYKNFSP